MVGILSFFFPTAPFSGRALKSIDAPPDCQVENSNMPDEKEDFDGEAKDGEEGISCPLCRRLIEDTNLLSDHHLVPRSRGGRATQIPICLDCHKQIHAMYSNKRLEEELNSVEALFADPKFARFAAWVAKRPLGALVRARRSKDSRRRGRSG